jgi:ATP-dependent helicase/DNAse subunit B
MAATPRFISGPWAASNTQQLLAHSRAFAAESALWLLPSRRAAISMQQHLAGAYAGPGLPRCLTLQQFADEIVRHGDVAARPVSLGQRRLIVDEEAAARRDTWNRLGRLSDSRYFADLALAAIAELKQHRVSPLRFQEAQGLGDELAELYFAYQSALRRHGLYDPEGRMWYAAEMLRGGKAAAGAVAVFVDGFTAFTPLESDFLAALATGVEAVWVALPDVADDREELWSRPRRAMGACAAERAGEAPAVPSRSAGLAHLQAQLFRRRRAVVRAADAAGVVLIEAPGVVGEARMVAREIRRLLAEGTAADDILVTMRDVAPYADLLCEVFDEYGIPADVEGTDPMHRNPAVATLLRALRLPEEDWPFAAVTALLRSGYFRPPWPEAADPEMAQHAEALLRMLGEPRGREAYLGAVKHWAEKVHPGLEDEQADESRRRRKHELAVRCGPFLERFFRTLNEWPGRGKPAEMAAWLWRFVGDLGLRVAADERDREAIDRLAAELDIWVQRSGTGTVDRAAFLRSLNSLAAGCGLARTPRGPGRVRVLSADLAAALQADVVFILGLGERSFPRLTLPESLLDERCRQALAEAGLPVADTDRLPDEMLLFYRLATAAHRLLVLSYPAVDARGQRLLPSSFLSAAVDCFAADAIPKHARKMLIEGLDVDEPLSAAEVRVRLARSARVADLPAAGKAAGLPTSVVANVRAAAELVQSRMDSRDFTRYDGMLRDAAVVADLARRFGPGSILSPTALENYVACPFKFLLRHVLALEPLDEPNDEVESTERGLAFHRALARLHNALNGAGQHEPHDAVEAALLAQLDQAVNELAKRASRAGAALWQLEGQRLKRAGRRYRGHWHQFVAPWLEHGVRPRPHLFEAGFGLPPANGEMQRGPLVIAEDGVEVRISGRIDRLDVAELPGGAGVGFWVIDYKTGRGGHYTGSALTEFTRLQLTLYALAAEEVLLQDGPARPLGLAYWLVADEGAKPVLPGSQKEVAWLDQAEEWAKIRATLRKWVVRLVTGIRGGEFPLQPRSDDCTATCDYSQVCRINQVRRVVEKKSWQLPLPIVD